MANGLFSEFNPLERLASNQYGMGGSTAVTRGTLISFHYPKSFAMIPNVIHDPYPMIIVTDIWPNLKYIRGVNLHYLTFPYVKKMLENYGGRSDFQYSSIQPDRYIAHAFRMYIMAGVQRPRKLDTDWLKNVLTEVRSFAPGEIEKIRANIQRQIQSRLQAKAKELTAYAQWRKSLTDSQQRQLRGKVKEVQDTLMGGVQRNLIVPNMGPQGSPSANVPPGPLDGGPTSTQ
jgi:hypothetical protein